MGIRELLNKLSSKNKCEISCVNDLYEFPAKEKYITCPEDEEQFISYKREYSQILSQRKTIVSIDLISNELKRKQTDYIRLILNIMKDDISPKIDLDEKINLLVSSQKLALYFIDILKLEKEVVLRFYALFEIYSSRKLFLLSNRKHAILHGMEILQNTYNALASQKVGLYMNAAAFSKIAMYANKEAFTKEAEEAAITKKYQHITSILKGLGLKPLENSDILREMAGAEKTIEEYVYYYDGDLDALKKEISDIAYQYVTKENKDELLEKVNRLIPLCQAFTEYGKNRNFSLNLSNLYVGVYEVLNVANEDDRIEFIGPVEREYYNELSSPLWPLYWLKFDILTFLSRDNNVCEAFDLDALDNIERKYYEKIIFHRFINYFAHDCAKFRNYFYNKYKVAIKTLKNLFLDVINNDIKVENFKRVMQIKVPKESFDSSIFYEEIFSWDDEVPMETIFRLFILNGITVESRFYKLWDDYSEKEEDNYYFLEGIKEIHIPPELSTKTKKAMEIICKEAEKKYVLMPKSLRGFHGDFFGDTRLFGVEFKEGFKELGHYCLCKQIFRDLSIPSTVSFISPFALNSDALERVELNYINGESAIDFKSLYNLFCNYSDVELNGERKDFKVIGSPDTISNYGYNIYLFLEIYIVESENDIASFWGDDLLSKSWTMGYWSAPEKVELSESDIKQTVNLFLEKTNAVLAKYLEDKHQGR